MVGNVLDRGTPGQQIRALPGWQAPRRMLGSPAFLAAMSETVVGVLGGSGLYEMQGLEGIEEHSVVTPFGSPSDVIVSGRIQNTRYLFLPRHGRGHRFSPTDINYQANVLALKMLGAKQLVSVSAVGSMTESAHPGDVVLADQFIDRTCHRKNSFFQDLGVVAHVGFSDPVDAPLSDLLYRCAVESGAGPTRAAPTCASRARSSRPAPSRTSTAAGAPR
jgi:purine nucleoside phosphorylase